MSDIRSPEFWQDYFDEFNAGLDPYRNLTVEEVDPNVNVALNTFLIREVGKLAMITYELATEPGVRSAKNGSQPKASKKVGRPPRPRPETETPPSFLAVAGQETSHIIQLTSTVLSPDEARSLGARLLEAADAMEGVPAEGISDQTV